MGLASNSSGVGRWRRSRPARNRRCNASGCSFGPGGSRERWFAGSNPDSLKQRTKGLSPAVANAMVGTWNSHHCRAGNLRIGDLAHPAPRCIRERRSGRSAPAVPFPAPSLDALKEELFLLETDRVSGAISREEYDAAKHILEGTFQRAADGRRAQ
jgi:hypothetical protein